MKFQFKSQEESMQRKLSRKSVKSNKGQFQKSAARKRRTGVQKSISTGTNRETSSGREKISLKPRKSPVKPDNTNIRVHGRTNRAPAAKTPKQVSPQLQQLERGQRLKRLHEKGQSLAEIAGKHRYSKSLVRDLVNLASLPRDLEEAYLQGKIGRKTVVEDGAGQEVGSQKESARPNTTAATETESCACDDRRRARAENLQRCGPDD